VSRFSTDTEYLSTHLSIAQKNNRNFTMKFSSIVFLSAAFGSALSLSVQLPHLADGTYLISIDGASKQILTDITANTTDAPPRTAIPKREAASVSSRLGNLDKRYTWPSGTYPWCPGGDWFLFTDFYDHSRNAFYDACAAGGEIAGSLQIQP
jgi:hypothetical protein